ncbi:hypothetical protein AVEN_258602-1 [Araneus ventricosus]|uniref:EGF-like domain-containing protein n=1 Tax=Araneus ventricosus TaxID=182803 RepID=A0A4Y2V2H5_ARAVE|nr:hypothetical protein AVEN_258602-1 [Araneus ventricosus]
MQIHPPQRVGCSCTNGKCVIEDGKEVCKCNPGFGYFSISYCKACDCGPNQGCKWKTTGWFNAEQICFCNPGYSEDNGKCVATPCSSNPCKNGGNCTHSGSSFTCKCVKPYTGKTCETSKQNV